MSDKVPALEHGSVLPEIAVYFMDGHGSARKGELDELSANPSRNTDPGFTWVHLHRDNSSAQEWLQKCDLDSFVMEALSAEETRPRCTVHGNGAILILRGVNLNPGAEPEDMISTRLWIEEKRVIGVWIRPLKAINDLFDAIETNRAPSSPGDLVAKLALRLADRAEPTIANLNERIDELEENLLDETVDASKDTIADIRRAAITLRRYMFPQRDALTTFEIEDLPWLTDRDRSRIREAADRVTRLGEELDAIRDRAQVVHDQIIDKRSETLNRRMFVLSVVTAIFLPLGLLTGLLGINVGGIPGTGDPWAFLIVCGLLLCLGGAQLWLFKRLGMMR
ncbi:zinc transporter ZntB [Roseibium aggregatum]|uniref:zinc transporter ZntB n=1 Tax=Roseibium aggregatum TaxID=187304 RepID=UPI00094B5BBB|nr:zinc transporter ZntB [Roseibium aggregatum]UFI06850.1 zinc transporter ZntB [Roseibium aggregatum]